MSKFQEIILTLDVMYHCTLLLQFKDNIATMTSRLRLKIQNTDCRCTHYNTTKKASVEVLLVKPKKCKKYPDQE